MNSPSLDPRDADPITPTAGPDQDYQTVVGLLSAYSACAIRLVDYQQSADLVLLEYASKNRSAIADLQERQNALSEQMEILVRRHPEWFSEKKSLSTPCGTIKLTATSKLDVTNEELSIALIRNHHAQVQLLYLRVETSLNLEALEALSDVELERLKIKRVTGDSFSIVPAKANLGKAIKAATPKEGK